MNNKNLLAPCGVYCGVCPQMVAYKNKDERLKEKLASMYGIKPRDIVCDGCCSDNPFMFCVTCAIKTCVQEKNLESCADCESFPCEVIDTFPVVKFVQKIKWDVQCRRDVGKDQWIAKTKEMNTCSSCGTLNHWVARRCIQCKGDLSDRY